MTTITQTEVPPVTTDSQSFLLKRVQPALSGLMDGSLSTLAPLIRWSPAAHDPAVPFSGEDERTGGGMLRRRRRARSHR